MSEIFKTSCFDTAEAHYYAGNEKDAWYWLFLGIWEVEAA